MTAEEVKRSTEQLNAAFAIYHKTVAEKLVPAFNRLNKACIDYAPVFQQHVKNIKMVGRLKTQTP